MQVQQIVGKIEVIRTLPDGDRINLEHIIGWDDLHDLQKAVLSAYVEFFPKVGKACHLAGTSRTKFRDWKSNDRTFQMVLEEIEALHKEALSAVHYKEGYQNSKIRGQVLKSLDAKGYERKDTNKTTNNLVIKGNMKDIIKQLGS